METVKIEKYMVTFILSLNRMKNFEVTKKVIKDLHMFPAANTINNFTYYSDIGIKEGYCTYEYCEGEEVKSWPGKLGCNISHQLMYDEFLKTDADWCLVLEDDCSITNYDEDKLTDIIKIANRNNSNFIQLYTNPGFIEKQIKEKKYGENLYKMFPQWHTIAYLVSRKGIQLLKEMYPMNENIDKFLSNKIEELNSFCWINDMFLNGGEVPDVKPTIVNGEEIWLRSNEGGKFSSMIWHGLDSFEDENFTQNDYIDTDDCEFCPDFIIAGTQKGGTTASISYMEQHRDIHMPFSEIHFFDDTTRYKKGLDWYKKQMNIPDEFEGLVGEKTPDYCISLLALERIYKHCPNVKLILFLRNPVLRAYSQWNMHKVGYDDELEQNINRGGLEERTFKEVIDDDIKWKHLPNKWDVQSGSFYARRGFYIKQIEYICKKFGRENLHITISERCRDETSMIEQYNNIFRFLDLSEIPRESFISRQTRMAHKGLYKNKISKSDYDYLHKIYKPYNQQLFDFLGYEIDEWK